jgi:hypothetical protein
MVSLMPPSMEEPIRLEQLRRLGFVVHIIPHGSSEPTRVIFSKRYENVFLNLSYDVPPEDMEEWMHGHDVPAMLVDVAIPPSINDLRLFEALHLIGLNSAMTTSMLEEARPSDRERLVPGRVIDLD